VDTPGGRYYAELELDEPVTREGQLIFFAQFLHTGGRWSRFLEGCPLRYEGNRGSGAVNVLGTATLSILCGHWRYALIVGVFALKKPQSSPGRPICAGKTRCCRIHQPNCLREPPLRKLELHDELTSTTPAIRAISQSNPHWSFVRTRIFFEPRWHCDRSPRSDLRGFGERDAAL
jgi:hypothetical protein